MLVKSYHGWHGKSTLKHKFISNKNEPFNILDLNF